MRKIIIMLIGLFLMVTVVAVSVNQILTQDNVDAMNVSDFDLQEGFIRDGNNKIVSTCEDKICSVQDTMISADKEILIREVEDNDTGEMINESYWSGDYIVVNRIRDIKFRKQPWADMRDETNATYTRQQLSKWLKSRRARHVSEERRYLEGIQTNEGIDLSDILADLQ